MNDFSFRPDPRLRKWYVLQFVGGSVAGLSFFYCVYLIAQLAQARRPLDIPWEVLPYLGAGLAVHVLGRLGVRRLR